VAEHRDLALNVHSTCAYIWQFGFPENGWREGAAVASSLSLVFWPYSNVFVYDRYINKGPAIYPVLVWALLPRKFSILLVLVAQRALLCL